MTIFTTLMLYYFILALTSERLSNYQQGWKFMEMKILDKKIEECHLKCSSLESVAKKYNQKFEDKQNEIFMQNENNRFLEQRINELKAILTGNNHERIKTNEYRNNLQELKDNLDNSKHKLKELEDLLTVISRLNADAEKAVIDAKDERNRSMGAYNTLVCELLAHQQSNK